MRYFHCYFICMILLLGFSSNSVYSNTYKGLHSEFFFGRQPSARSEAMGRTMVASNDGIYTAFFNPACISLEDAYSIGYSDASLYLGGKYNYIGLLLPIKGIFTISFQKYNYTFWGDHWDYFSSPGCVVSEISSSFYTFSVSKEIIKDLSFGLSFNHLNQKEFHSSVSPIDMGLLKIFRLKDFNYLSQKLNFGISIKNIMGSKMKYYAIGGMPRNEYLPILLFSGISYELRSMNKKYLLTLNIEYEDVLNYKHNTGLKCGVEFNVLDVLMFRLGHYQYTLDSEKSIIPRIYTVNVLKNNLEDITYGLGVKLPLSRFPNQLCIQFDITILKEPSYYKDDKIKTDFISCGVQLIWKRK